eukprot:6176510-Pleurochrysis_carterae.AAC.1
MGLGGWKKSRQKAAYVPVRPALLVRVVGNSSVLFCTKQVGAGSARKSSLVMSSDAFGAREPGHRRRHSAVRQRSSGWQHVDCTMKVKATLLC